MSMSGKYLSHVIGVGSVGVTVRQLVGRDAVAVAVNANSRSVLP